MAAAWSTRPKTIRGRANVRHVLVESMKTIIIRPIFVWNWDDFFHSRMDSRVGGMIDSHCLFSGCIVNTGHLKMMDFDLFFVHLVPTNFYRTGILVISQ
jgi:hypothetical protein